MAPDPNDILNSLDYRSYGIHITVAVLVWCAVYLLFDRLMGTGLFFVTPVLLMAFITSDYFLVVILEQFFYLWYRSFCPFFMIFDFYPWQTWQRYIVELRFLWYSILGDDRTVDAFLDLAAAVMRLPRAIFWAFFINTAFCRSVYQTMTWVILASIRLPSWLWYITFEAGWDLICFLLRLLFLLLSFIWRVLVRVVDAIRNLFR